MRLAMTIPVDDICTESETDNYCCKPAFLDSISIESENNRSTYYDNCSSVSEKSQPTFDYRLNESNNYRTADVVKLDGKPFKDISYNKEKVTIGENKNQKETIQCKVSRKHVLKTKCSKNLQVLLSLGKLCHTISSVLSVLVSAIYETLFQTLRKSHTYFGVKVKFKNSQYDLCLGKRDKKEKWIFENILRPFRSFPQINGLVYPFLPQRSASNGPFKSFNSMEYEGSRLSTFGSFPDIPGIYVIRLAEAGFYYTGNADEVVCFRCGVSHKNWRKYDNPSKIHIKKSPDCSFVKNELLPKYNQEDSRTSSASQTSSRQAGLENFSQNSHDDNKTSSQHAETAMAASLPSTNLSEDAKPKANHVNGYNLPSLSANSSHLVQNSNFVTRNDTTGLLRIPEGQIQNGLPFISRASSTESAALSSSMMPSVSSKSTEGNTDRQKTSNNASAMGICLDKPKYTKFSVRSTREETFKTWPKQQTQPPEEMTLAGFFYTGVEDHCRCFFCGGGLKNWDPEDRPWIEHARWYPECAFLKQCMGEKFVQDVQMDRLPSAATAVPKETVVNETRDAETQFLNHPAVASLQELGYGTSVLKEAFEHLQHSGENDITSFQLLEAVFYLEENGKNRSSSENVTTTNQAVEKKEERKGTDKQDNHEKDENQDIQLSVKSLEEENQNLRDQQTCKICLDEPIAIVFLPCGHLAACVNCAPALRKCPICRTFIKGTVKAIMC